MRSILHFHAMNGQALPSMKRDYCKRPLTTKHPGPKHTSLCLCWLSSLAVVWLATGAFVPELSAAESVGASGKAAAALLHLKVDFAPPSSQTNMMPVPGTAKEGWFHWVIPGLWDFYRSSTTWEDRSQAFPRSGPGIAGSGVHAAIGCHYESIIGISVAGMRRCLAGAQQPVGKPLYEPICNSWISATDFPNNPTSDLLLPLYDLLPGKYRLLSYHNAFNHHRVGNNPTWVESSDVRQPEPPMPSIKVYAIKTVVADYFAARTNTLVKGKTYGTPQQKMIMPGAEGPGRVRQTLEANNVVIQQVKTDAELKPSVIEFTTDGSPLMVVYAGGCCKNDDLRPQRRGGYAVLNAFELVQLSAKAP